MCSCHRILTIWLYFVDLITDAQVALLFYNGEAYVYAFISCSLMVGQFAVVYLRVLPYLHYTYGGDSTFCVFAGRDQWPQR